MASESGALDTQPTNIQGVMADLIQYKRKKGVLSIKVKFTNTSDNKAWLKIDTNHGAYKDFYVMTEDKKYFVLKDSMKHGTIWLAVHIC